MTPKERGLSHVRLRQLLRYDQTTGLFIWLTRRSGQPIPGSVAGTERGRGYIGIKIDGVDYMAHRLAWFYVKGAWPVHELDHRDLNKKNNAWGNLREATHAQNMRNVRLRNNSASGLKGVYPLPSGAWTAQISLNGKTKRLGTYRSAGLAHTAYLDAARACDGEFARAA